MTRAALAEEVQMQVQVPHRPQEAVQRSTRQSGCSSGGTQQEGTALGPAAATLVPVATGVVQLRDGDLHLLLHILVPHFAPLSAHRSAEQRSHKKGLQQRQTDR